MERNLVRKAICVTLLFLLSQFRLFAQPAGLDEFIRNEMKDRKIPGLQLAVVKQGKIVLNKSYGWANVQDSIRTTNQSIFTINSCTKAFTGVAIMQLVEEGKVDLSAPISQYLDGLPASWQPVTITQMLTHVSGLPDILKLYNVGTHGLSGVGTDESLWKKVMTLPMDFATGTQFSYNQTNYALLGQLITKLSGKPFTTFFKERQFDVVGMPRTLYADTRDVVPGMIQSYRLASGIDGVQLPQEKLLLGYAEFIPSQQAGSGLNSTAGDLAKWIIALQQGKLLKTKTALNTLWKPGKYNNNAPTQWALGWMTRPRAKHRAIIATGGTRSAFSVYPDDDLAVVILTNLAGSSPEDMIDELAGFYNPEIPAADPITALKMELRKRGFQHAVEVFNELKKKDPAFIAPEADLNDWAYRMMRKKQLIEAKGIFKLNTILYPESWNVYDSYGEVLAIMGDKDEAIRMYRKSLELNPGNKGGERALERLMK